MKKLSLFLACAFLTAGISGCAFGQQGEESSSPAASSSQPASVSEEEVASESGEAPAPTEAASASGPSEDTAEPPADAEPEADAWEQQAVVLTDQIVNCCLQTFDESVGITELNEREIFQFVATLSRYKDESGYPYAAAVTITEPDSQNPNLVAHVAEADAQSIAYQLFGVSNWSYDAPDCYDSFVPEYYFNLEAGLPYSPYSPQEATAEMTGDSVVVSFRLTDSDSFAYAAGDQRKDFGQFQAVYQIISEEGKNFLRFQGISPA